MSAVVTGCLHNSESSNNISLRRHNDRNGRVCSRTDAKYAYSVEEFQEQMKGIYTTTANAGSIDECPMAYKAPDGIIALIEDTVSIERTIRPIYNFKAT